MRLAVISDIHGNLTALDAVAADIARRGVDEVVHAGDVALMGARPAEVVDRLRELKWTGIRGNTDELLWCPDRFEVQLRLAPKLEPLLRRLFDEYAPATNERLAERIDSLRELPPILRIAQVGLVHARPGDLWRAPMPDAEDAELADVYGEIDTPVAVYGHIHRPFVRRVGRLTIANAGSVGLPWDGDPRASYLLIDGARAEVVRVPYSIDAEVAALRASHYPDRDRISAMLRRGRFVPV